MSGEKKRWYPDINERGHPVFRCTTEEGDFSRQDVCDRLNALTEERDKLKTAVGIAERAFHDECATSKSLARHVDKMHKRAQSAEGTATKCGREHVALTRRVEEWEAALRSVSEYRDEYEQDGEAVNEMRKIARRALAQRSEPLPDFHGDTKAVTQYEPLDLCPLCDEETDNPGKVCSACVCKDLGGTPGYDNQRSEPPAFGMEAEAIASAQLAMKNDQHSEPASNPPSDDEVHAAIERFKDELRANPHVRLIENDSKPAGAQRSEPTHKPGCPRLQYWDAGEYEASCNCDDERSEPADAEG